MAKYYLKVNFKIIDNKRVIDSYSLYNNDKLIETLDFETSNNITKEIIKYHNFKHNNNDYIIDDINLIKKYINLPSKKVSHKNINVGKIAIAAVSAATMLSLTSLANNHFKDDNLDNSSSVTTYYYSTKNNENYESPTIKVYFDDLNHSKNINTDDLNKIVYSEPKIIDTKDDFVEIKQQNIDTNSIYSFNYEDRSNDERLTNTLNLYGTSINNYSNMYGIDKKLIAAFIAQENPNNIKNYSDIGGHGIMQIESIWNGQTISAYNFETNSIEVVTIDTNRANEDPDYCIKIGCMIFSNYYNNLNNNFGDKLDDETLLVASLFAYNKGITQVTNSLILNVFNLDYFLGDIKNSTGGDNNYDSHVLSFLGDTVISIKDNNGNIKNILIDNTNINENNKITSM